MNISNNTTTQVILPTSNDVIQPIAFYVLTWLFFALCDIALVVRLYIRYACFRRLWYDDYLMLVALVLHTAVAILIQLFLKNAYDLEKAENGDLSVMGPDFLPNSGKAFVAIGASINITMVGVLMIKLSFLLFFRRLGTNVRFFNPVWWGILLFTVAASAAQIGMQYFHCFFADINDIFSDRCTSEPALHRIFINSVFSAIVDALSDFLKYDVYMVLVLLRVQLCQKITNTSPRAWSAFLVACIVSFRALFVQRESSIDARQEKQQQREAAYRSAKRRGWRARARQMHDSVLDTFRSAEEISGVDQRKPQRLPDVPSGLMTVNFEDGNNWGKTLPESNVGSNMKVSNERDASSTGTIFQCCNTTCEYSSTRL
ncbi:hypothetical protein PG993_003157 [Apiospora rasikravindrae]|uniref:Rhodopsin domain-containing protein n=1 Tax=Apiospora rasikravindrae TaxID=990691 RepID=A0ABR1TZ57_9PEZI